MTNLLDWQKLSFCSGFWEFKNKCVYGIQVEVTAWQKCLCYIFLDCLFFDFEQIRLWCFKNKKNQESVFLFLLAEHAISFITDQMSLCQTCRCSHNQNTSRIGHFSFYQTREMNLYFPSSQNQQILPHDAALFFMQTSIHYHRLHLSLWQYTVNT